MDRNSNIESSKAYQCIDEDYYLVWKILNFQLIFKHRDLSYVSSINLIEKKMKNEIISSNERENVHKIQYSIPSAISNWMENFAILPWMIALFSVQVNMLIAH